MLCYIESDRYGNDLALLEEVVETYTFFPLNEICGGFFFGAFNIMVAIEDMPGMQSLYLKTQVCLAGHRSTCWMALVSTYLYTTRRELAGFVGCRSPGALVLALPCHTTLRRKRFAGFSTGTCHDHVVIFSVLLA